MAYDQKTGERLRKSVTESLGKRKGLSENRMFGGLTFLVGGNMCCGVAGDELVVRVSHERSEALATRKHARLCDFTGRPMRGLVMIEKEGFKTSASLGRWVSEAVQYATSLPAKASKRPAKKTARKTAKKKAAKKKTTTKQIVAKKRTLTRSSPRRSRVESSSSKRSPCSPTSA
jgi:TfoX/Sxy family transcriptional regulator of competence genes